MSTDQKVLGAPGVRASQRRSPLEELLKARIAKEGPITYEAFVETALYDDQFGYYKSGKPDQVDYYTASEIHPVFGRTIGRYIETLCHRPGVPPVTIVELGGASGRLARAVNSAFDHLLPDAYFLIEKGADREEKGIRWISEIDKLPPSIDFAFVFANEFFDALPFHRISRKRGTLQEMYVAWDGTFFETPGPLTEHVEFFLNLHPVTLPEGQSIEVTTYGVPLLEMLSSRIRRGYFLLFDYGYHNIDIERGRFPNGSELGYRRRKIDANLFAHIGQMDITHHVNFDHLSAILFDEGWQKEGETEQYRFLMNAGIADELSRLSDAERLSAKWLVHPELMGSMISALAFSKGTDARMPGFRKRD
jgi:SAM-dependent MidA family methyltransferase